MKKIFLLLLVIMAFVFVSCKEASSKELNDYPPMVYWNDQYYMIQYATISPEEKNLIEIGEILVLLDPSEKLTENSSSNEFEVGSPIYVIKGIDENKSIVVFFDAKYYEAIVVE